LYNLKKKIVFKSSEYNFYTINYIIQDEIFDIQKYMEVQE